MRRALALARPVRLLVLDVDGVLTDNAVSHDGPGPGFKRFGIQDGMGVKLCQHAGIEVAVISGLGNIQAEQRSRELGIHEFHGGHLRKLPVLENIMAAKGLGFSQVAYMGDDWLDAQIMARVGLALWPRSTRSRKYFALPHGFPRGPADAARCAKPFGSCCWRRENSTECGANGVTDWLQVLPRPSF